ncbi:MAG: PAC2 family protein [Candidatus Freyarchaeota archaeon]|nr:PAC2 family protein [Candidatus Jordarchaeia archaeon]
MIVGVYFHCRMVREMYEIMVREIKPKRKIEKAVCVHALPDITEVGALAVKKLVKVLNAEKIIEVEFTDMPPMVIVEDGVVRPPQVQIYAWNSPDCGRSLLLVTGDDQPMTAPGIYALSEQIAKLIADFKVKFLITLGGYLSDCENGERRVYFTSTGKLEFPEMEKLERMPKGEIVGANGLVPVIAKEKYEIDGVILLSKVDGKIAVSGKTDVEAANLLLRTLKKYLNLPIEGEEVEGEDEEMREESKKSEVEFQSYIY